jgi:hypothetical protein
MDGQGQQPHKCLMCFFCIGGLQHLVATMAGIWVRVKEGSELVMGAQSKLWNWQFVYFLNFTFKFDFKSIILVEIALNF